jgi:hypothetical protein
MLSFSLPKSNCFNNNGATVTPLDKNAALIYLTELDKKLRQAKESMEPYFKKYDRNEGRNIFKTVTSNFESFKLTRYQIAQNRNTPSVSNAWIKAYELISHYNLIPETRDLEENNQTNWNHFDNCSFPGSFILAVYHYIYTKRDKAFQDAYNWFASSLLSEVTQDAEHPDAALGDQYELYKRYGADSTDGTNHWLMEPDEGLNGNILDFNYINHIADTLGSGEENKEGGQVDLYTSEYGIDVSEKKLYNEQEFVHAKGDLAQVLCGLKTLRYNGNMICKIFTFFNPFTISLLALMRECFEEFYISKPASSKPDNSEVFIVGKEYNPEAGRKAIVIMEEFLENKDSDYRHGCLVDIEKLDNKFWKKIKESAYKIFEELQINRILSNVVVFDKLVAKYGDPNASTLNEDKIKRASREEYQTRIDDDNKSWFANYPVLVLHKKHRLNVIDITERQPMRPRTNNRPPAANRPYNNNSGNGQYKYKSNFSFSSFTK